MSLFRKLLLALCSGLLVFSFMACQKEGPAEKAGEKVDKAMEQAEEKMEQTGEKMEKAVEETGEKMEKTMEETGGK
jgi:hypothetical protein